jgi:streptomycin 6-kinase
MTEPDLPQRLRAAAETQPEMQDWLAGLPAHVEAAAARWSLRVGPAFQPGGVASWVAPVVTPADERAVLKVGWRHWEAFHEADGLRAWRGNGTVRLLDYVRPDERTDVLLLEACEPGTSADRLPERDQDVVVAGLLRRLWIVPEPGSPFRPLAGMCAQWADEVDVARARSHVGHAGIVRDGLALFRALPTEGPAAVLLTTDLHCGNVLAARREPWLVIDPKPYVGDPTYDPLQHMLNCRERLTSDPRAFARRMAGLLDVNALRLQQWLFARCVVESAHDADLAPVARALAAV